MDYEDYNNLNKFAQDNIDKITNIKIDHGQIRIYFGKTIITICYDVSDISLITTSE